MQGYSEQLNDRHKILEFNKFSILSIKPYLMTNFVFRGFQKQKHCFVLLEK